MANDDFPINPYFHVTMSDEWYEQEFKRQNHYRELKPKKCCYTCKHGYVDKDGYTDCYVGIDDYPHIRYDVTPFGLCDKYEPKEESK